MPFLILLILTLTCVQGEWPKPHWLELPGSILLTWAGVGGLGVLASWQARRLSRRLYLDPCQRSVLLRAYSKARRYQFLGLVVFYLLALYFLGWGWAVHQMLAYPSWSLPGSQLLALSPFFVGLALSWACFYPTERAVHDTGARHDDEEPFPARWAYVGLQLRHNLILALPPLLLLVSQEVIFGLLPQGLQQDKRIVPVIALGLLACVFVGIPWVLRLFLGLKPLPPGPLRDRLLATSGRLNFRCSELLLWNTRNTIANAMVTGPLPFLRYVVLTDRLTRDMTEEEVEAVFGHEVGHVKHHHMLFYFAFLMVSLFVLAGSWVVVKSWLPDLGELQETYQVLTALPLLTILGAYIFVVFGFLSRRCERQADIFGCRTVSGPVFIEALEKVARLNGIHRENPGWLSSWQHSTIARRVEFLEHMSADPTLEPRFQRRVGLLKWGMALGLGAAVVALFFLINQLPPEGKDGAAQVHSVWDRLSQ